MLAVVGAGRRGGAMLRGWRDAGRAAEECVRRAARDAALEHDGEAEHFRVAVPLEGQVMVAPEARHEEVERARPRALDLVVLGDSEAGEHVERVGPQERTQHGCGPDAAFLAVVCGNVALLAHSRLPVSD